jgi:hypothetical protein
MGIALLIARDTFRVRSIEFVDLSALASFGEFPHWLRSAKMRHSPSVESLSRNCQRGFSFPFLNEALRFA